MKAGLFLRAMPANVVQRDKTQCTKGIKEWRENESAKIKGTNMQIRRAY